MAPGEIRGGAPSNETERVVVGGSLTALAFVNSTEAGNTSSRGRLHVAGREIDDVALAAEAVAGARDGFAECVVEQAVGAGVEVHQLAQRSRAEVDEVVEQVVAVVFRLRAVAEALLGRVVLQAVPSFERVGQTADQSVFDPVSLANLAAADVAIVLLVAHAPPLTYRVRSTT